MRRTTSVPLLMGCLMAVSLVHHPAFGQVRPRPGESVANRPSGPLAAPAGAPDTQALPADDAGWEPRMDRVWLVRTISGGGGQPGPHRLHMKSLPYTGIGAHRHSQDMRITVLSGRQFILMGDLETARAQRFDPGTTFVIPAGVWHVEWFESETIVEIEINEPWDTEIASPATPRVP